MAAFTGLAPTGTVVVTVLVLVLITETVFECRILSRVSQKTQPIAGLSKAGAAANYLAEANLKRFFPGTKC
jgi:hypothetical protein